MALVGFEISWRASPAWVSIFGGIRKILAHFPPVRRSRMSFVYHVKNKPNLVNVMNIAFYINEQQMYETKQKSCLQGSNLTVFWPVHVGHRGWKILVVGPKSQYPDIYWGSNLTLLASACWPSNLKYLGCPVQNLGASGTRPHVNFEPCVCLK